MTSEVRYASGEVPQVGDEVRCADKEIGDFYFAPFVVAKIGPHEEAKFMEIEGDVLHDSDGSWVEAKNCALNCPRFDLSALDTADVFHEVKSVKYPRRAESSIGSLFGYAEQLEPGAPWHGFFYSGQASGAEFNPSRGEELIASGICRETFAHHAAPVETSDAPSQPADVPEVLIGDLTGFDSGDLPPPYSVRMFVDLKGEQRFCLSKVVALVLPWTTTDEELARVKASIIARHAAPVFKELALKRDEYIDVLRKQVDASAAELTTLRERLAGAEAEIKRARHGCITYDAGPYKSVLEMEIAMLRKRVDEAEPKAETADAIRAELAAVTAERDEPKASFDLEDDGTPEYGTPAYELFDKAITWTVHQLKNVLGVKEWSTSGGGTETLDGDLRMELNDLLKAAGRDDDSMETLRAELARAKEDGERMRAAIESALKEIEQYTRFDFYMWLMSDPSGRQSDPPKKAVEAKSLLTSAIAPRDAGAEVTPDTFSTREDYAKELDEASDVLQRIHPMGKVIGIGRRQVAEALRTLEQEFFSSVTGDPSEPQHEEGGE